MAQWLTHNWFDVVLSLLAFLATIIVGMWSRRILLNALDRWSKRTRILVIVVAASTIFDILGIQTTPLILLAVIIVLGATLALKTVILDLFTGFQLNANQRTKEGDYVRL